MHKPVKGGKRTKKQRGGYYGAVGAIAPGAMQWGTGSEMGGVGTRGGNTQTAGRRRTKKATKKSKLSKRRKMRGGNKYGGVSASFQGEGIAGTATYVGTTSRGAPGSAAQGAFNNFGAAPGSKFNI